MSHQDDSSHQNANTSDHNNLCPGLADAQRLAAIFSLNTDAKSDDIEAICALHTGTFKGTPPNRQVILSHQVLGYGEIDQLLTYAQDLASPHQTKTADKLTSDNTRTYLAAALQHCGTTPLATCINGHLPSPQSDPTVSKEDTGNPTSHSNDNRANLDNPGSGNKNTGEKSTSTVTP